MVTLGWNIFGLIVFLNISMLTTKYLVTHRSISKFVKFVVITELQRRFMSTDPYYHIFHIK